MRNAFDVSRRFALAVTFMTAAALSSCAPAAREEPRPAPPQAAPTPVPVVTPPVAPVPDDKARLEAEARERAEREAKARAAAKAEAARRARAEEARKAQAAKAAREAAEREAAAAKAAAEKKVEPPPPPPVPPKANLARYVPAKMMQDVATPVDLWADRKLSGKPLQDALLAFVNERQAAKGEPAPPRNIAGAPSDVVDSMEVALEFDATEFRVVPEGRQRQDFRGRDQLRWSWLVTGVTPGVHRLTLHVWRIDASGTTDESYTDSVTVEAKPRSLWDRIVEMDNWLKIAIALIVALVLAWLWRRLGTRQD